MRQRRPVLLAAAAALLAAPLAAASFTVSPRLPASADAVEATVRGHFSGCVYGIQASIERRTVHLAVAYSGVTSCPADRDRVFVTKVPSLTPGTYIFQLEDQSTVLDRQTVKIAVEQTALALGGGRFAAHLDFRTGGEPEPTAARAVALTGESGYFWFYGPLNPEVTLKVLDGRGVNGHFWVFVSGLTDRPFTLVVRDDGSGCAGPLCAPERTYTGAPGQLATIVDLQAF